MSKNHSELSSRWRSGIANMVNALTLLLLLDAAIESWIAGSEWRLGVAVIVFVYFCILALVRWRFSTLWQHTTPGSRMMLSVFIFTSLVIAGAVIDAGAGETIRVLGQAGDKIFAATMIVALVAAVATTATWKALPVYARILVGALAAYSIIAFVLALIESASFRNLIEGAGFWSVLPWWLGGAAIGCLLILPVASIAVLAQMGTSFGRTSYQTRSLIGLTFLVMTVLPHFAIWDDRRPELAIENQADALALLETTYEFVERSYETMQREAIDANLIFESVGRDIEALYDYVSAETTLVPYKGTLRGAHGVLVDKVGNSLDRSILLRDLLARSGYEVRLARATLAAAEAESLLESIGTMPTPDEPPEIPDGALKDLEKRLGIDLGQVAAKRRNDFDSAMESAIARARDQALTIAQRVPDTDGSSRPSDDVDALRDHWWVQSRESGEWRDLDPSQPAAGTAMRAPTKTYSGSVPDDLFHKVRLRIVVEHKQDDERKSSVVLDHTVNARDVIATGMRIQNYPSRRRDQSPGEISLEAIEEWMPALFIGNEVVFDKAFTLDGRIAEVSQFGAPGTSASEKLRDVSGIFDSLPGSDSSGEDVDSVDGPDTNLVAYRIEYEIHVPGQEVSKIDRYILNVRDDDSRVSGRVPAESDGSKRRRTALALAVVTDIFVQSADVSEAYAETLVTKQVLSEKEGILKLVGSDSWQEIDDAASSLTSSIPVSPYLIALASNRGLRRNVQSPTFIASPNVLTTHTGIRLSNAREPAWFHAFDIVWNRVDTLGGDERMARIYQGVFDTHVEAMVSRARLPADRGTSIANTAELSSVQNAMMELAVLDPDSARLFVGSAQTYWNVGRDGTTVGVGPRGWGDKEYIIALKTAGHAALCVGASLADSLIKWEAPGLALPATALACSVSAGAGYVYAGSTSTTTQGVLVAVDFLLSRLVTVTDRVFPPLPEDGPVDPDRATDDWGDREGSDSSLPHYDPNADDGVTWLDPPPDPWL